MEVDTAEDALRSSPVQHASDQSTGAPAGIRKQLLVACQGHSMHSSLARTEGMDMLHMQDGDYTDAWADDAALCMSRHGAGCGADV